MRRLLWLTIVVSALAAGCGRKIQTATPRASLITPEDQRLYRQGLAAFREATPEGYTRAADSFRKASALDPNRCEYSLRLAESLLFLALEQKLNWEDYEPRRAEATAIVNSTMQQRCQAYEAYSLRLRALIAFPDFVPGNARAALEIINRAIELDPRDALNWVLRWKLDPTDHDAMPRAVEISPDLPLVQYELGYFNMAAAKYADAKKAFERAVQLNPRHFHSFIGLADSSAALSDSADVEPYLLKAVEVAPRFLDGRNTLASYYADAGETEKAVEQYRAALASNSAYHIADFGLGNVFLEADRTDEAEKYFIETIRLNPGNARAFYYLGNIWFNRGDLVKARAEYDEALRLQPNFAEANYALGAVFYREGDANSALVQFEKVLRINMAFADAYFSRGTIRFERRQIAPAIDDYNRAITVYEGEIALITGNIRKAETRGLPRKVQALVKRRQHVETTLQNAREYRMKAEQ